LSEANCASEWESKTNCSVLFALILRRRFAMAVAVVLLIY
jgi:hypothetical protein